jgi:ParB-like chromosome segregation protein Spo0J
VPARDVTPLGTVQAVPIERVKPYPGNPRKIPPKAIEQVARSIQRFGWQQPLVVDGDMVIVMGHARMLAARRLKLAEVPVIVDAGLTPEEARALRVVDNRTHDYAGWDYHQLLDELNGLGEEFAPVLDLADWRQLIRAYEDSAETSRQLPLGDATEEDVALALSGGYAVRVVFTTKAAADQAGPQLAAVPGVIDVRHPH